MSLKSLFSGNNAGFAGCNFDEDQTLEMAISATAANAEVETASAELNRLVDIAVGLDNLTLIGDNCPKAGKVELALFDTAVNMMVAGENVEMPSIATESNVGRSINTQSIKTIASSVWNSIKKLMVRIRDAVVKFFKDRWGESARLRKRLKALIAKCDKKAGLTMEEKKFEIGSEFSHLYVENVKVPTKDLMKEAEKFQHFAESLYDYFLKDVNAAGEVIKTQLEKFNVDSDKGGIDSKDLKPVQDLTIVGKGKTKFLPASDDKNAPKGHTRVKFELLGNQTVMATDTITYVAGSTHSEQMDIMQRSRLALTNVADKKKVDDKGQIDTMGVEDVRELGNKLLEVLDIVDGFENSKEYKEIAKLNKDLQSAGDSLEKSIAGDDVNKDTVAVGKGLQKLASGYSNWTSAGFVGFASHFNRTASALVNIGNKCLDQHK